MTSWMIPVWKTTFEDQPGANNITGDLLRLSVWAAKVRLTHKAPSACKPSVLPGCLLPHRLWSNRFPTSRRTQCNKIWMKGHWSVRNATKGRPSTLICALVTPNVCPLKIHAPNLATPQREKTAIRCNATVILHVVANHDKHFSLPSGSLPQESQICKVGPQASLRVAETGRWSKVHFGSRTWSSLRRISHLWRWRSSSSCQS